ncbi:Eco57I restriction-modification methylase domain-containing protein, partial [Halorubrum sp. AJ67]|uniref:Eco57I restriction-modification methylase domain-containing protein n=1 Tax=Halorubrum sp. AJ67 TaxID=1173487 RepID=UPI00064E4DF0
DWTAAGFGAQFGRANLDRRLRQARRERRERRRRNVEEFYDRYVEVLFGEGTEHSFETNLLASVSPPDESTPESERRRFALALVNRLLFLRVLEEREVDGIERGFLAARVERYEASDPPGSLYESEIRPLFADLLNTPKRERPPDLRDPDSRRDRVPCLNDGLFRSAVPNEAAYDVEDGILKRIISELIEGTAEGGGPQATNETLDPSVIGTAFEKVINHLGAKPDVGLQKEELGAIYTPPDVTERITERTVEPAIEAAVVDALLDRFDDADERAVVRSRLDRLNLGGILDHFAVRERLVLRRDEGSVEVAVPFDEPNVIAAALERVTDLRVVDPACGSGHFLTAAVDRLHRAQIKLLTGLNDGDEPSAGRRYEAKRELALTGVFGVDVHEAATEIARLRVWLKVIEDNGWEESYAQLPNVDANVVRGNALVGFPVTGDTSRTEVWNDDIAELEERRLAYKFDADVDADTRDEISDLLAEEIRPELDEKYVSLLSETTLDEDVESREELRRLVESIPDSENVSPSVQHVKARPAGGGEFSDRQQSTLEAAGFDVFHTGTTANLDVGERERVLKTQSDEASERLVRDLEAVLEERIVFTRVERQPLPLDLPEIKGRPFHWIAEFPEAVAETDSGYALDFDVVLGNPPYGDLLTDGEKRLLTSMETGVGYEELRRGGISGNFIERQLHLLSPDGFFGNIVTVGVLSSSERGAEHDLIVDGFESAEISSFARRPSQVFDRSGSRVEINPTIITGRPAGSGDRNAERSEESPGAIRSSDFLRFTDESREATIESHDLSPAADLVLRDRIGGDPGSEFDVFPKVGGETKRGVLEALSDAPKTLGDWEVDESPHRVRHRRSFNYWLVATRGGDDLNNMKEYCFPTETARDFAYLAANSSLLYGYHMTYGNMQDFGKGRFRRFPAPARSAVAPWRPLIRHYADLLEAGLRRHVESSGDIDYRGERGVKAVVDEVEFLLGSIYGLSPEQVRYLQTYDSEFARHGPDEYEPVPDAVAEAGGNDPVPAVGFDPETERDGDGTAPF